MNRYRRLIWLRSIVAFCLMWILGLVIIGSVVGTTVMTAGMLLGAAAGSVTRNSPDASLAAELSSSRLPEHRRAAVVTVAVEAPEGMYADALIGRLATVPQPERAEDCQHDADQHDDHDASGTGSNDEHACSLLGKVVCETDAPDRCGRLS